MTLKPTPTHKRPQQNEPLTARIRILETTDLHMQLLAYDYFADAPTKETGLVPLAGLIESHRNDPLTTTFLFDNGDFLQGNPLADLLADEPQSGVTHPMIAAMNRMAYDAVCLGNHEFNYGLEFLTESLGSANFTTLCANATYANGDNLVPSSVMIDRDIVCDDGQLRQLRLGVMGLVTPQVTCWDGAVLNGHIQTTDIVETAAKLAPVMRADGAEVIVALCHSGIGPAKWESGMENAAIPLAGLPDIDVVLAGHIHDLFPNDRLSHHADVDTQKGKIHGKPAVMAGFYGSHLGVITLDLAWSDDKWQITRSCSHLERATPKAPSTLQQDLTKIVQGSHARTLDKIRLPVISTRVPINSHFATTAPDLSLELLADAQTEKVRRAALGQDWAHFPILSSVAPFRAGGRGGPQHYFDIKPGDLTVRDASAIHPFNNQMLAVLRTGAQITDWLEVSAKCFRTLEIGTRNQNLRNEEVAPYFFDVIYGLTYCFDLSVENQRVRDLKFNGKPVAPDDIFVVASNSYRANGGGGFFAAKPSEILYRSTRSTREILVDTLRKSGPIDRHPRKVWEFAPLQNTTARFLSAPNAHPPEGSRITATGDTQDGFAVFEIALS